MSNAQEDEQQSLSFLLKKQDRPSAGFHAERRDSLRSILPKNSVAVFFSNPIRNRSNDVYYEYHQNPNFYYLTGLNEPNSAVFIFKNKIFFDGDSINEMLFVQKKDSLFELWNGERLGVVKAAKMIGIQEVLANIDVLETLSALPQFDRVFYIEPIATEVADSSDTEKLFGLYQSISTVLPQREKNSEVYLEMMMAMLRQIKTEKELQLMRRAINITCAAQIELMKALEPGMYEYETEAIVEYVFHRAGAQFPGFPSIHGGGANSCILHYISNREKLKKNDLLVSDIGAELHGYTADVTRTIPVDGLFDKEEKAIYELVLKAQKAGIAAAQMDSSFYAPHRVARKIIAEGLMDLGIIQNPEDVGKYFMHGTSHYLGLDVHDVGLYQKLQPGNVITVEPGIYIKAGSNCDEKWWNIGVRIEDDILIREEGPENLSEMAPKEVEDIEKMMQKEGAFGEIKFLEEN